MSVDYQPGSGWEFHCIFGCFDYGYTTEERALDAFLNHDCLVAEPCS